MFQSLIKVYTGAKKEAFTCGSFTRWGRRCLPPYSILQKKIGIEGVNSTLATAISASAVVLLMSWGMVFLTGTQAGIAEISRRSWLFLEVVRPLPPAQASYHHALQVGAASKVVPIDKLSVVITLALAFVVLHEPFTAKSLIGCALITAGTLFMVL